MSISGQIPPPWPNGLNESFMADAAKTQVPVPPPTPRQKLLDEARRIVSVDRNSSYGNPEDNFKQIAELWTAYKHARFTSVDVAVMCMLIKVARLAKSPGHHDSAVDIAGYAACLADVQEAMKPPAQGGMLGGAAAQGSIKEIDPRGAEAIFRAQEEILRQNMEQQQQEISKIQTKS